MLLHTDLRLNFCPSKRQTICHSNLNQNRFLASWHLFILLYSIRTWHHPITQYIHLRCTPCLANWVDLSRPYMSPPALHRLHGKESIEWCDHPRYYKQGNYLFIARNNKDNKLERGSNAWKSSSWPKGQGQIEKKLVTRLGYTDD